MLRFYEPYCKFTDLSVYFVHQTIILKTKYKVNTVNYAKGNARYIECLKNLTSNAIFEVVLKLSDLCLFNNVGLNSGQYE